MKAQAQIVSFHCVLKDKMGKILSSTFNHDVITQLQGSGHGDLLPGLADGLQNLRKGEKRQICLAADKAYGFYDPELVIQMSRKKLSQGQSLQAGHQVFTQAEDGETKVFRVIRVIGDAVTLDGNHPLAGQDLVFDIETTEARDATLEEIAESAPGVPVKYYH